MTDPRTPPVSGGARDRPEIGFMFDFRNPPWSHHPWDVQAHRTIEACRRLDEHGAHGLWFSEHHFTGEGYLPALMPMAAAVGMVTGNCRIGTCVLLAPLHHPVGIAEAASVVDCLTGGRFVLGMGLGYRQDELDTFGVSRHERSGRLEETLEILTRSWGDNRSGFRGDYYGLPAGIDVDPKPLQDPIPIWLAARSVPAAQRAGRLADGVILVGGRDLIDAFWEEARIAGREDDLAVATTRAWVCSEMLDPDDLVRVIEGQRWRSSESRRWYAEAGDLPRDRDFSSDGAAEAQMASRSLREEVEALEGLAATGITHVMYHASVPGVDPRTLLPQWLALLQLAVKAR